MFRKFMRSGLCMVLAAGCLLCACTAQKEERIRDLDFSVMDSGEIPQELQKLIEERKNGEFRLSYNNEESMYIAAGYGLQQSGGYSICVKELYLTENSIVFDTELLGPEKPEMPGKATSCPYIVIKTENLDEPIVFR